MKRGTSTHRKIARLATQCCTTRMQALGMWAATLEYVAEHAPTGDVTDHMDAIARFCDWPDHEALTEAMLAVRMIDRMEDDRLIVHGWSEHAEDSVHTRLACSGQWFADGTRPSTRRLNVEQRRRADERLGTSPTVPLCNVVQRCVAYRQKAHVPSPSPSPSPSPTKPAAQASEPASRASAGRAIKTREPDPLWDTLADLFFDGKVPRGQAPLVGKVVRDLREMGATADEIRLRHQRAVDSWGSTRVTINSMHKNWGVFSREPTVPVSDGEARRQRDDAEFAAMVNRSLRGGETPLLNGVHE